MPNRALLIIDMQNDLCLNPKRWPKVQAMLPDLVRAIDSFSTAAQPVLYSCFALSETDDQFARFGDRYCVEGTRGAEIIAELHPLRGVVFKKRKHSAFFETELDDRLRHGNVSDLYLAGLQTQICIMTTAADASFRGYRAIAIRECVVSTQEKAKSEALDWIAKYVGEVRSLEEVLRSIRHEPT